MRETGLLREGQSSNFLLSWHLLLTWLAVIGSLHDIVASSIVMDMLPIKTDDVIKRHMRTFSILFLFYFGIITFYLLMV